MILFQLSQCRPHYNVRSWHEDWLKTLKVMDSIARYPRGRSNQQKVTLFSSLLDKVTLLLWFIYEVQSVTSALYVL